MNQKQNSNQEQTREIGSKSRKKPDFNGKKELTEKIKNKDELEFRLINLVLKITDFEKEKIQTNKINMIRELLEKDKDNLNLLDLIGSLDKLNYEFIDLSLNLILNVQMIFKDFENKDEVYEVLKNIFDNLPQENQENEFDKKNYSKTDRTLKTINFLIFSMMEKISNKKLDLNTTFDYLKLIEDGLKNKTNESNNFFVNLEFELKKL